jgi:transposase
MRQVRKVLEYRLERKLSIEQVGLSLVIAKGTVVNILQRFERSCLGWPLPAEISDTKLEEALYPAVASPAGEAIAKALLPDLKWIETELRRPHVTLQRLWEQYHEAHSEGLSRSAFYRYWDVRKPASISLKIIHKGGDNVFVDYSGDGPSYVDKATGEIVETKLFVACWGASSYTYADATMTERSGDFVRSHVRAWKFFGGCSRGLVPDNLKSGVVQPDRYEPRIHQLYEAMARHYHVAVLPARIRKPKDKAVVESAVLQTQRFILARLRDRQFFSLDEINVAIREELELLNTRPMKDYGNQTRKERFELLDKPYMQPIPAEEFKITSMKLDVRVAPNYHVRYGDHYYSVPFALVGKTVDIYQMGQILELYHDGIHLLRHKVGAQNFTYTTIAEHMPQNHRYVRGGWTEEYFLDQAETIGSQVRAAVEAIMKRKMHPQQAFNAAKGVLQLSKAYSPERLLNACLRALHYNSASYQTIKSILEQGLDKQIDMPLLEIESKTSEPHENLRGNLYFAG